MSEAGGLVQQREHWIGELWDHWTSTETAQFRPFTMDEFRTAHVVKLSKRWSRQRFSRTRSFRR